MPAPLTQSGAANAVAQAVSGVSAGDAASVRLKNVTDMSQSVLKAMEGMSGGVDLTIKADTMADSGAVDVRLTLNPAAATKGIDASASTANAEAEGTASHFGRFFANSLMSVSFGQEGDFGMEIEVAARLAPGLAADNLTFYVYDKAANSYTRLVGVKYWVDSKGYVHFPTSFGGILVISDGALTKR
jgi:hypothetical protein